MYQPEPSPSPESSAVPNESANHAVCCEPKKPIDAKQFFSWRVKMWVNKTTTLEECLSINILYLYIVISFSFSVSNIASQCKCGWSKIVRKFQWYTRSNYLEWLLTLSQMYTLTSLNHLIWWVNTTYIHLDCHNVCLNPQFKQTMPSGRSIEQDSIRQGLGRLILSMKSWLFDRDSLYWLKNNPHITGYPPGN